MSKKYWEFKNQTDDSADLYLYIQIASWGGGCYAHSAQSFKQELDALGNIKSLNVYINSPGGDVFEGNAIYNMLKRFKADVNVYVDGVAASIASVIAMSGKTVNMPKNSMLMIHNAWTYVEGNSDDLRKMANTLDKVNTSIRQAYLSKAGDKLDEETLIKLMDATTWLTAQECYDYGLCDNLLDEVNIAACVKGMDFKAYKNVPKALIVKNEEPPEGEQEDPKELKANNELELAKALLLLELQ